MRRKTGVFGGTFDPVHNGHLFLALEALHECQLDRVLFIPNRVPPHKEFPLGGAEARWEMLLAAIEGEPRFEASRLELDRTGPSYTLDTLKALGDEDSLVFICGADAFRTDWYRPDAVLEQLETLLLAHRFGVDRALPETLGALRPELTKKIRRLDFPDIAISSSDIRQRIAAGRPFRYLIPDSVFQYIQRREVYLSEEALKGGLEPEEKGLS